jgi:hypothetical protein
VQRAARFAFGREYRYYISAENVNPPDAKPRYVLAFSLF